jgi:hypothetical protein
LGVLIEEISLGEEWLCRGQIVASGAFGAR